MSKDLNKFDHIKLTKGALTKVDSFKAIVPQGKQRKILDKNSHEELINKKYDDGTNTKDHITLFRVKDKKLLPQKEIKEHTVQGPEWTPPSSVAYVMGGLSKGHRVWSATEYTRDNICGKDKNELAILARESMTALMFGWIAREPQDNEKYGNTERQPKAVFTPPTSPRKFLGLTDEIAKILDVNAKWNHVPMSLNKLTKLSTPISKELSDFLKKTKLPREDFHDLLVTMVMNNELSVKELSDAPVDTVKVLLLNQEVVLLLSDKMLEFSKLLEIYDNYIEYNGVIGEFSFRGLYNLIVNNESELASLLSELDLNLNDIIELYNQDHDMFCAFANDNALSFFREYGVDCDIQRMVKIYGDNKELFYDLINDDANLLNDVGVEDFIDKYEEAQREIASLPEYSIYSERYDAYDLLKSKIFEDGCPDELLNRYDSYDNEIYSGNAEDYVYEGNDEDSDCSLDYEFGNISLSGESSVSDYDY